MERNLLSGGQRLEDRGLVYALALVFVFLALAALYESWGLPLAILMSVPVAVLGAVLFVGGSHLMNSLYVNDIYMQISLVMLIGWRPRTPFWSSNTPTGCSASRASR